VIKNCNSLLICSSRRDLCRTVWTARLQRRSFRREPTLPSLSCGPGRKPEFIHIRLR